jgi:hypothetical protein
MLVSISWFCFGKALAFKFVVRCSRVSIPLSPHLLLPPPVYSFSSLIRTATLSSWWFIIQPSALGYFSDSLPPASLFPCLANTSAAHHCRSAFVKPTTNSHFHFSKTPACIDIHTPRADSCVIFISNPIAICYSGLYFSSCWKTFPYTPPPFAERFRFQLE